MRIRLANRQARDPVPLRRLTRVAARAVRRLRLRAKRVPSGREGRAPGMLVVTFVDSRAMRRINQQFLRHRGLTDVVSFRYDLPRLQGEDRRGGEPLLGEILVAPSVAKRYAREHRLAYEDELARYVVHGLLHWAGHDDRTAAQRRRMRKLEDRLLRP